MSLNNEEFRRLLQHLSDNTISATDADYILGELLDDGRPFYTLDTIPRIEKIKRRFKYLYKYANAYYRSIRLEHLITGKKLDKTGHICYNVETIKELETALFGYVSDMLLLINSNDNFIKQIATWRMENNI